MPGGASGAIQIGQSYSGTFHSTASHPASSVGRELPGKNAGDVPARLSLGDLFIF